MYRHAVGSQKHGALFGACAFVGFPTQVVFHILFDKNFLKNDCSQSRKGPKMMTVLARAFLSVFCACVIWTRMTLGNVPESTDRSASNVNIAHSLLDVIKSYL